MSSSDPGTVACPFCQVGPGQACEMTATRRPLRHRKYHPARHRAVGAPEPSLSLPGTRDRGYEPLDMDKVARSWEKPDGAATEVDDPAGRSTGVEAVADEEAG